MLAISKSNAMFFKHQDYKRRLSTLKISQESVDGLIFRGGGGGGGGLVRWRKGTTYLQRAFKCKNLK